jgi:hypothetical protein
VGGRVTRLFGPGSSDQSSRSSSQAWRITFGSRCWRSDLGQLCGSPFAVDRYAGLALPPMFTVMVETTPALGHPTRAMVPHSPVAVPYYSASGGD